MTALRPLSRIANLVAAGAFSLALLPSAASALGLGQAEMRSYLGQPLRMRIPVIADSAEEVGCVVVHPQGEDLPAPRDVHAEVLSVRDHLMVELRTTQPVNDLTVAIRVTVGCSNIVSRDYVLFVDPPPAVALPDSNVAADAARAASVATASSPSGASGTVSGAPDAAARPRPVRHRPTAAPAPATPNTARDLQAIAANAAVPSPAPLDTSRAAPAPRHRPAAAVPAQTPPTAPRSDRLVLSRDVDEPALSMAEQVAKPDSTSPPDIERMREIQRDQARLVAILTNHDPNEVPNEREVALQKQLADLSNNLSTLSRQVNEVSTRNRTLEATRVSRTLAWVLACVTLLALCIATWLAWRYRELQRRMADTPWWEQTKIAPVTSFGEHLDDDHDHRPASTDGVEVEEVMPNTVPRPATASDVGVPTEANPVTSKSGDGTTPELTSSSGLARQNVPSLTQYKAPPVNLWPMGEPDLSREREEIPQHSYIPFGLVSVTGSIDETVNADTIPVKLDLELDLPMVAAATPAPAPEGKTLPPLNLELRKSATSAPGAAPPPPGSLSLPPAPATPANSAPMTGDSVMRSDDVLATIPLTSSDGQTTEPASIQFRLVQFAAVLEQIDEMEKLREPAKAIALLRQFVLRDEMIPTLFWLLLFHFYRQINKKPVYEALGEHFSRRYRRTMVGWEEMLSSRTAQTPLAELPAMDARVRAGWGTLAGIETIRSLLCDRDQGDPVVFNEPLQRDLLKLAQVFPIDANG